MPKRGKTKKSQKLRTTSSQLSESASSVASSARSSPRAPEPEPEPEPVPQSTLADAAAGDLSSELTPTEAFDDFLKSIGLAEKRELFLDTGFDEVSKLRELSEDHLEDLALDCECDEKQFLALKVGLANYVAPEPSAATPAPNVDRPTPVSTPAGPPPPLDEKQVEKLKKLFIKWDPEAKGSLTPDQLRTGLKKVAKKLGDETIEQIVTDADKDGDGTIDYDEFVEVMEVMLKASKPEPVPEPENEDGDGPLKISELTQPWKAKNWTKIKVAAKVAAKEAGGRARDQGKKAVFRAIGKQMVQVQEDDDWPEWKAKTLVDAGQSVEAQIAALPELEKPREPFDIFRAKTIKKLHDRNPTMEYSYLKEMAEEMWNVLFDNEKDVYEKISAKEKEEYQVQLEHREVLDYALNTLGIVDPRYLWIAQLGWRAPLPSEDWIVCKDTLDDQERVYYYDTVNDISQWEHPLDQHFRDQVKAEKQKLFDAVSRVQGRWRGIKHRRRREIMEHQALLFVTATKLQAAFRGRRQRRRDWGSKYIQRCFRGYRVRWRIDMLKEEWAATLVSGAWRTKMARRRLHALVLANRQKEAAEAAQREKDNQEYILLWHTTVTMQRKWRAILRQREVELRAITRLQASFRGQRTRRMIEHAMVEAAAEQRRQAELLGGEGAQVNRVKIKLSASKLQSMSIIAKSKNRGGFDLASTVAPAETETLDEDGNPIFLADIIAPGKLILATQCAMRLQAAYRRKLRKRRLTIFIQAVVRAWFAKKRVQVLREERAIIALQRAFRGYQAREQVADMEEQEWMALVFQSYWRGNLARKERNRRERERAAVVMQRWYRGRRTRRGLVVRMVYTHAAVMMQSCWRGHLGRQEASWRLFMALWLQEFSEEDRTKIRYIQGHFRGRLARRQMVAFRTVVSRARAATVIQKNVRGWVTRKKVKGVKQQHDWAWNLYRGTSSATETVYQRLKQQQVREERTAHRVVAMSTPSGHSIVRSLEKPPLLPEDRERGPEAALVATTPATPLHLLMRAAKEDGFRLPAIGDIRSHSPAFESGHDDEGQMQRRLRRRGAGQARSGFGKDAVSAAGRWKGQTKARRSRRRRRSADGRGSDGSEAKQAAAGARSGRRGMSLPELQEEGWQPREVDPW